MIGFAAFDSDAFLRDHWQKAPCLIRNPWAEWHNPLAPDELAGLACEPGVESRLITLDQTRMQAEDGPLAEDRFTRLGREPWTLLVQAVDHHVPAVAKLIQPFRFVPDWRIDDVMVSYATDGGGVGAHFDHYDVFLVQGLGRRRWRIGARCDDTTPLLPHDDLRLLADFRPTAEWVLEPGDILYVPPGFAHEGVALGDDCMTYSVGFRAPSQAELIGHWADDAVAELADDARYADPDLNPQDNPGEIAPAAIDRLQAMVLDRLADRDAFARWFGGYTSTPKYADMEWRPETPLGPNDARSAIGAGIPLMRNPASRFAFIRLDEGAVLLFVDGECFTCNHPTARFAQALCAADQVVVDDAIGEETIELIVALADMGSVAFLE